MDIKFTSIDMEEMFSQFVDMFTSIYSGMNLFLGKIACTAEKDKSPCVKELQTNDNIKTHIHLVWYCIQGAGGRITKTDLKLIKDVLSEKRTMVVITKKDITKPEQLSGMIDYLVECGISRGRIVAVSELDPAKAGREELVNKSIEILPEAYKEAFVSKQQVNLKYKKDKAKEIIKYSDKIAGRWGLIPYFDWVMIIPKQLEMAAKLATNYGVDNRLYVNTYFTRNLEPSKSTLALYSLMLFNTAYI